MTTKDNQFFGLPLRDGRKRTMLQVGDEIVFAVRPHGCVVTVTVLRNEKTLGLLYKNIQRKYQGPLGGPLMQGAQNVVYILGFAFGYQFRYCEGKTIFGDHYKREQFCCRMSWEVISQP